MKKITVEYVWLDGDDTQKLRSKTKILTVEDNFNIRDHRYLDLPDWNYDGSSTNQADTDNSEIILKPHTKFIDPFVKEGLMVMCDSYDVNGNPIETNNRYHLEKVVNKKDKETWYGFEQEYIMMDKKYKRPLGFPHHGDFVPKPQGDYYCGVGANHVVARNIAFEHMNYCLTAGIEISGINSEVLIGQWEYQVGPISAMEGSDQLWMSRYILYRVGENHNIEMNIHPKPLSGDDWNGSGLHVNFSTNEMRDKENIQTGRTKDIIEIACEKLRITHEDHIKVYGEDNDLRLTGNNETANIHDFKWGYGDRTASIRIPYAVRDKKAGYLEDRRPSSNGNPYLIVRKLIETIC